MRRLWLLPLLLVAGVTVAEEPSGLVDRVIAAYGGAERLDRLDAYRVIGRTIAHISGGEGKLVRDLQGPMKLRVDIAYPDRRDVRVLNGVRGWRGSGADVAPAHEMQITSMIYQFLRSDIPRALDAHRTKLEGAGTKTRNDVELSGLRLPWSEQLVVVYWLEPADHRVVYVEGHIRHGEMAFDFATEYSDFREVDGFLYAFREESHAGGSHVGTTTVDSLIFDPENPGPFAPGLRASR